MDNIAIPKTVFYITLYFYRKDNQYRSFNNLPNS